MEPLTMETSASDEMLDEDGDAARGLVIGLLLSIPLWAVVIAAVMVLL
jgi:hypothetical protein